MPEVDHLVFAPGQEVGDAPVTHGSLLATVVSLAVQLFL